MTPRIPIVTRTETVPSRAPSDRPPRTPRTAVRVTALLIAGAVLLVVVAAAFAIGSSTIPLDRVWRLLRSPDGSNESYIVGGMRFTRVVIGLAVGCALAVAGAVMQAVTRNPLADPGLLGVTSGGSLAVVLGAGYLGMTSPSAQFALCAVGSLAAAAVVFLIGTRGTGSASPMRLVLAGIAFSAAAGGVISAVLLLKPRAFDAFRFWDVGGLTRMDVPLPLVIVPVLIGLVLVLTIARGLTDLSLGDDVAAALGTPVARTRLVALAALTLLCAAATAAAGPISFVGLVVPLVCAWIMGPHRGWIIALSAIAGPILVLSADVVGRVLARPGELAVGLLIAFVGAPVLLAMVLRLNGARR